MIEIKLKHEHKYFASVSLIIHCKNSLVKLIFDYPSQSR